MELRGFIPSASPSSSSSRLSSNHHHLLIMIRPVRLPLGFAPRMARLTLAFLPSMIGFGSLHARSAASLFDIITWNIFLSGWKNISLISNAVCVCVCFNLKSYSQSRILETSRYFCQWSLRPPRCRHRPPSTLLGWWWCWWAWWGRRWGWVPRSAPSATCLLCDRATLPRIALSMLCRAAGLAEIFDWIISLFCNKLCEKKLLKFRQ